MAEPTARGLASAVGGIIREGRIAEGGKLPPIRSVAVQLGLSPTTVSAAWAILQRAGMIATGGRNGTRIAPRQFGPRRYRSALRPDGAIAVRPVFELDLSTGTPDPALLPSVAEALARIRPPAEPSSYLDEPVLPELAEILHQTWPYPAEQITVTDGAMDALQLITAAHLKIGDRVAVEDPTFPPLLDLLESVGAVPVGIGLDTDGARPAELAAALGAGVRAVVLQPRGQNPTGVSMTARRAAELAELVRGSSAIVIEDDSLGAIAAADDISLGSRIPDQVLHVRSYSKSHGPDLRLAALGGPARLMEPVIERRFLGQGWTSRLLQRVLTDLLTDPSAIAAVHRARGEYARRRAAVAGELARLGVDLPAGDGLNIYLPVADETAALLVLATEGIGVSSGGPFRVTPGGQPHLRITVGMVPGDFTRIAEALARAAGVEHTPRGR